MSISAISGVNGFSGAYPNRQLTRGQAAPAPVATPAQPQATSPATPPTGGTAQGQQLTSDMLAVLIAQQGTLTGSSAPAN